MEFPTDAPPHPKATQPAPQTARPAVWVEVVSGSALASHASAWQDLADHSIEPNAFYEPWMLRPALESFGQSDSLAWAFVYHRSAKKPDAPAELIGFFPWEKIRRYKGFPVRVLRLWKHVHCFLCTPLVREGCAQECFRALFDWARGTATLLDFDFVAGDGPFYQELIDFLNERNAVHYENETFHRALLKPQASAEKYVQTILSSSHRSELRRQRKKLGELGQLQARRLELDDEVDTWVAHFLGLEASGWKGTEQTTFQADAVQKKYFETIARAAFARGQLMMLGLFLDGRPIAMKCNFLAGAGAFAAKIAFDEALAKFSPGVLLELDNIENVHQRPGLAWMDSCAAPRHFMINRLWRERRTIVSRAVSVGKIRGDLFLGILPFLRCLRRVFRSNPSRS